MIETTIMLKDEKDWPAVTIYDEHGKAAGRAACSRSSA
jgi:hypothetical protein